MKEWKSISFLLVLAVGLATAETLKNAAKITEIQSAAMPTGSQNLDYESALRPAVLQKRSIANIARLLLGGNVPPNHPLVKYPEPKTWNLANNIVASLPGSSLAASASSLSSGWAANPNSAMSNLQSLFETKAKLIPHTGQIAQGITGLAQVKGDLLRQIHTISTQAIAQAAAEAAARALASAAAAHAVTNTIGHSPNHGAQTGIKGGYSSYPNTPSYYDKTPGDMPGPPYPSYSAHINQYSPPPSPYANNNNNAYVSTPPPLPPPVSPTFSPINYQAQPQPQPQYHQQQQQQQQQQMQHQPSYYTLYNSHPPVNGNAQNQAPSGIVTPAPIYIPHQQARPTLSPSTLIATTTSGYSPSLPLISTINISCSDNIDGRSITVKNLSPRPVVVVTSSSSSNNTPLPSSLRTVPAGIFGRNASPHSAPSLLSSITSLLSASTAAYNSAFTGAPAGSSHQYQHHHQHQHNSPSQQPSAFLSNLLSSASSQVPATPPIPGPTSPYSPHPTPSVLSSGITSAASVYTNNGYQRNPANPIPQGGGHYGSPAGSYGPSGVHHHQHGAPHYGATETRPSVVNPPGHPFNQHAVGNHGGGFAQPSSNSYIASAIQSSPQFGPGYGHPPGAAAAPGTAGPGIPGGPGAGYGAASFSTAGNPGYNGQVSGPRHPEYNGGPGPSNGHAGGWNTQHAGSFASASTWPGSASNGNPSGYSNPQTGNSNNPSGGYGRVPAQQQVAAGSSPAHQAYPSVPQNAYQPPAANSYAQAQQQPLSSPPYAQPNQQQFNGYQQYQSAPSNPNGASGLRNPNLNYNSHNNFNNNNNNYNNNYQRQDSHHDQNQSASTMGNDYDDDYDNYSDDNYHHNIQQAQRRSRPGRPNKNSYNGGGGSRYPPGKQRTSSSSSPSKRPNESYNRNSNNNNNNYSNSKKNSNNGGSSSTNNNKNSYRGDSRNNNNDKRVTSTGSKQGFKLDSSVDVVDIKYASGERFYDSEEKRNTDKNRWRSKNPSGQWTNSFHNLNPNGRWRGETSNGKQTPPENVRGNEQGQRPRPQSGLKSSGKSQWNQKLPSIREKPKAEEANLHGGRVRSQHQHQQGRQQSTTAKYKSRDVYTTLPEFVFKVGERPDVFLRPGGKLKQRKPVRGRLSPRFGETAGSGSSSSPSISKKSDSNSAKEDMETAFSSYIEHFSKENYDDLEKSTDSSLPRATSARGKGEKLIGAGAATDETASERADILGDFNDSGFLTASEEFDPEEREAFVEDVYADDHQSSNQRRNDYQNESGSAQNEDYNEDEIVNKKKKKKK